MKHKRILITFLLEIAFMSSNAQRIRGIYATSNDFIKGNLSFDNNCSGKTRIRLNDFFCDSYITIKENDRSFKRFKKNVFGYINCKNQVFRFKSRQELLLLNTGDQILIYKIPNNKPPPCSSTNVTNYFFSIGGAGSVQKLTIKNLKEAFADNKNFQQLIDDNFKYNTDLARYDDWHMMYQIDWLLKKAE